MLEVSIKGYQYSKNLSLKMDSMTQPNQLQVQILCLGLLNLYTL